MFSPLPLKTGTPMGWQASGLESVLACAMCHHLNELARMHQAASGLWYDGQRVCRSGAEARSAHSVKRADACMQGLLTGPPIYLFHLPPASSREAADSRAHPFLPLPPTLCRIHPSFCDLAPLLAQTTDTATNPNPNPNSNLKPHPHPNPADHGHCHGCAGRGGSHNGVAGEQGKGGHCSNSRRVAPVRDAWLKFETRGSSHCKPGLRPGGQASQRAERERNKRRS